MQSESINELAASLAKAQGQIEGALKDSVNPFHKSKYADLSSVWAACRSQLSQNGLAVVQTTDETASHDEVCVITRLLHSSGQWIEGRLKMRAPKADPQGIGSCITYARRYALAAMVGICPEDDDAEAATQRKEQPQKQVATKPDSTNEEGLQCQILLTKITNLMKENKLEQAEFSAITGIDSLKGISSNLWLLEQAYDALSTHLLTHAPLKRPKGEQQ